MIRCHDSWNIVAHLRTWLWFNMVLRCVGCFWFYMSSHEVLQQPTSPRPKPGWFQNPRGPKSWWKMWKMSRRDWVIYYRGWISGYFKVRLVDWYKGWNCTLKSCLPYISSAGSGHPGSNAVQHGANGCWKVAVAEEKRRFNEDYKKLEEAQRKYAMKRETPFCWDKVLGCVEGYWYWSWGSRKKTSKDWCFIDGEDMCIYIYFFFIIIYIHIV